MPTVVDDTKKQVVVTLADTNAATIRVGKTATITKIRVNGKVVSPNVGSLTLRKNANNGPVVYTLLADASASDKLISDNADFDGLAQIAGTGFYIDAPTNAWAAGSTMVIHFTRGN